MKRYLWAMLSAVFLFAAPASYAWESVSPDLAVACSQDAGALLEVRALFERHEAELSRFLINSGLCALNGGAAAPHAVSPLLFEAIDEAIGWARRTGGIFDPTLLPALESAGYDRTFDVVSRDGAARAGVIAPSGGWRSIALDRRERRVSMPRDVRIDLGGIGKGFTVDRALRAFGDGACAMVNASGDLYAAGSGPDGRGWLVGVEDPATPGRDLAELRVRDRGVATSSTARRSWMRAGRRLHHLIDPATGQPAKTPLVQVTVVAANATAADVLAKSALLSGKDCSARLLREYDAEALFIDGDGRVSMTAGMGRYLA